MSWCPGQFWEEDCPLCCPGVLVSGAVLPGSLSSALLSWCPGVPGSSGRFLIVRSVVLVSWCPGVLGCSGRFLIVRSGVLVSWCPGVLGSSGRYLIVRSYVPNAPSLLWKQESSGESIALIRNPNSPLDSCFRTYEGTLGT